MHRRRGPQHHRAVVEEPVHEGGMFGPIGLFAHGLARNPRRARRPQDHERVLHVGPFPPRLRRAAQTRRALEALPPCHDDPRVSPARHLRPAAALGTAPLAPLPGHPCGVEMTNRRSIRTRRAAENASVARCAPPRLAERHRPRVLATRRAADRGACRPPQAGRISRLRGAIGREITRAPANGPSAPALGPEGRF